MWPCSAGLPPLPQAGRPRQELDTHQHTCQVCHASAVRRSSGHTLRAARLRCRENQTLSTWCLATTGLFVYICLAQRCFVRHFRPVIKLLTHDLESGRICSRAEQPSCPAHHPSGQDRCQVNECHHSSQQCAGRLNLKYALKVFFVDPLPCPSPCKCSEPWRRHRRPRRPSTALGPQIYRIIGFINKLLAYRNSTTPYFLRAL